ncbi:hypothetical protein Efla_001844 [Eimeria flavescens]
MLAPGFLLDSAAAAAAAALAAVPLTLRQCRVLGEALQGPLLLGALLLGTLLLPELRPAAAAAVPPGDNMFEEGGLSSGWPSLGSEYVLGSLHAGGPRFMVTAGGQQIGDKELLENRGKQMRNAPYGDDFTSYTEELRSFWLACQQDNTAVATVRTNLNDLTGFAACAELNLELDDTWADIPEGTGQLGYRWVLFPREPVGTDTHLRRWLAHIEARLRKLSELLQKVQVEAAKAGMSVPFDIMDSAIAIQYSPHASSSKAVDQASFLFSDRQKPEKKTQMTRKEDTNALRLPAVTQGNGTVLGRLQYKSLTIENNKITSFPEITVGTDGELCGLVLLRSLLKRAQSFGIDQVRIRVESSNIPLLRAASCLGFRPVDITIYQGKSHHTFIANPQLPLPATADIKQKIITFDRMARHLALSYFQAQALRDLHRDHSPTPQPEAADEVEVSEPSKAKDAHELKVDIDYFEELRTQAFLAGLGTIVLVMIAAIMWRKRKAEGAAAANGSKAFWSAHPLGEGDPEAKLPEDWFPSPPPHWGNRNPVEFVREGLSSEESEDWKETGHLDG